MNFSGNNLLWNTLRVSVYVPKKECAFLAHSYEPIYFYTNGSFTTFAGIFLFLICIKISEPILK